MGKNSAIEWTDHTWNPWQGCKKVSEGCQNCYMFRDMIRYGNNPNLIIRSTTTFDAPLKWKEPAKVFVCSWSDFFIEEADGWRGEAWEIIRKTPHLTYQILTKRPERMQKCMPDDWGMGWPNVWLGVTVENQDAVRRVALLKQVPAKVHFISCEPLLSEIDLYSYTTCLEWVIAGGESGPKARPAHPDWVRNLLSMCGYLDIPFFFKQWGAYIPMGQTEHFLDGTEWHQFPKTTEEREKKT